MKKTNVHTALRVRDEARNGVTELRRTGARRKFI
jgi:hypothetical protein